MGAVFEKLGFMRKLEGENGFTRAQAERLTDAFYDAVVESVVTKQDIGDLTSEMKDVRAEMKEIRTELKADVAAVRHELTSFRSEVKAEVAQLKVWAAGAGVVSVLSAIKFFS